MLRRAHGYNAVMAALTDAQEPSLVELSDLDTNQLEPLLAEEAIGWSEALAWDFTQSAELVKRFVTTKTLTGFGLLVGGRLAGYTFCVCEQNKGLVGDLYVLRAFRSLEHENILLKAALDSLFGSSSVNRVEAQLMMLPSSLNRPVPYRQFLKVYPRNFMVISGEQAGTIAPSSRSVAARIEPWSPQDHEPAARLIAASYAGHVDSDVNDQYRSVPGARRFLLNIVQYPGCGTFFPPGSFVSRTPNSGELTGLSLASLVAPATGHITQICVAPAARGRGLGQELLRHSLTALSRYGCRHISLTVTSANTEAVHLYERLGFTTVRRFAAYVWEGFRS